MHLRVLRVSVVNEVLEFFSTSATVGLRGGSETPEKQNLDTILRRVVQAASFAQGLDKKKALGEGR